MRESKHAFDGYVELILMELRSVTRLTLILFLILFPNLYYFMSFEPCFRCHSFEAALVHATGQALGFGEVSDEATNMQLSPGTMIDSTTCAHANTTELLVESPFFESPGAAFCDFTQWWTCDNRIGPNSSAMLRPDPLHTSTCLSAHDLEGLNWMYPSCSGARTFPVCPENDRNFGYLRLIYFCGGPIGIVAILAAISSKVLRKRQKNELARVRKQEVVKALWPSRFKELSEKGAAGGGGAQPPRAAACAAPPGGTTATRRNPPQGGAVWER